ncbi:hypothetical protein GFS24_07565 [Chitinophaga sp. SYP-B3965]|uniref:hypothetical protein n=1 Tax=Chitinophaga sp. SYP-B3965 TaxID=2663120 RepID=UPI00129996F6|nr:hypothetical protein [Chitinophaga sp. SYP-B3965]MRG44966.1 hypothetical protein [Chitinophaga sp. SYP-B3965]
MNRLLYLFLILTLPALTLAQSFKDGRNTPACAACEQLFKSKPKEVQFGIRLSPDGTIVFLTNNIDWFNKIFTAPGDAMTADLVRKSQYNCDKPRPARTTPKGEFLTPLYLSQLKNKMKQMPGGQIAIELGKVPAHLQKEELEGNLVVIKNGVICHYMNFVNIERSLWELLPMGLFADTLMNRQATDKKASFYSRKLQFTIPFPKNKSVYNAADLKPLYDSLQLAGNHITQMDIRAYSSVEGSTELNYQLQEQRAASIVKALQQYQVSQIPGTINAAENWVEFFRDIKGTAFENLTPLSQPEIKKRLLDKGLQAQLEPILKEHRKAVITIYINKNNDLESTVNEALLTKFKKAIEEKDLKAASAVQREVFDRIADNRLPGNYLDKLEIPKTKDHLFLLNNQETYRYQLNPSKEEDIIERLEALLKLDPTDKKIHYNICSLTFNVWKNDSGYIASADFLQEINELAKLKIPSSLVQRMLINYHIVYSEQTYRRFNYAAKDESIGYILDNYEDLQLRDEETLTLAKYLAYYSRRNDAIDLLQDRVRNIDVNEDMLFYYINLHLFTPEIFKVPELRTVVLNAITINQQRFCKFFNSTGNGGASFQLLDAEALWGLYCEYCK